MRRRTVEWQVCGTCNYDCSYCIQSKAARVGSPDERSVDSFLEFFEALPGVWEIKMTGGEPFAFKGFMTRIVPGLIERTQHTLSVLTNLSAPVSVLDRFADITQSRLGIVSASLHLEFTTVEDFVEKAVRLRQRMSRSATMVCNAVLVPNRLEAVADAQRAIEARGLRFFPQVMKHAGGIFEYDAGDRRRLRVLIGEDPTPHTANVAPSYRGRRCWTGVDYFVLTQTGDGWSCRTARRFDEGYLGNVHAGTFALRDSPSTCSYDICPCTVPSNRNMIEPS